MLGILGDYFDTYYVFAASVAGTGSALGITVFAPLTQLLLDIYGWRGAMLIIGGLALNLKVCGSNVSFKKVKVSLDYQSIDNGSSQNGGDSIHSESYCMNICRYISKIIRKIEFSFFKNATFVSLSIVAFADAYSSMS